MTLSRDRIFTAACYRVIPAHPRYYILPIGAAPGRIAQPHYARNPQELARFFEEDYERRIPDPRQRSLPLGPTIELTLEDLDL